MKSTSPKNFRGNFARGPQVTEPMFSAKRRSEIPHYTSPTTKGSATFGSFIPGFKHARKISVFTSDAGDGKSNRP